ncbi:sulfite exporter TauE/SafE family protein [Paracidovorax wautersii]|uniref:Sulfite exporter TauE/SafE n=1 Tax=Paracidovorax wautersii TaxID=1177982 RepID=A0ABU1ICC4_9BURK|nr:sulfite exporter TauE/SafE family protein [Paracidovorax wautersii]MDR6214882.1 sulfite exporter TauE/SafE [Paracidovorax wautersii]
MWATIAGTALLMGLAGGPHCLAMCAAPCGALASASGTDKATDKAFAVGGVRPVGWAGRVSESTLLRTAAFHLGRLVGYAVAGGVAALAMERLAWLTQHTAALRPAWTLLHASVLAWGLLLLVQARQPAWVDEAGRAVWHRVRPLVSAPGGTWFAGVAWALMPCGLLYSALLVAALSGGALQGAFTMALFGLGSGVWLIAGPWAWQRLRLRLNALRDGWGTRFAGLMLLAMGGWALWMDVVHREPAFWCL